MDTTNNRQKQALQDKMKHALMKLLSDKPIRQITVTELSTLAEIDTSTFYSSYSCMDDLISSLQDELEHDASALFQEWQRVRSNEIIPFLNYIKEHMDFFKFYFELWKDGPLKVTEPLVFELAGLKESLHHEYYVVFFRNGINNMLKLWLHNDCKESSTQIAEVLAPTLFNNSQTKGK